MLQAGAEVAADTAVRVVAPVAVVVEAVAVTEAEMDPVVWQAAPVTVAAEAAAAGLGQWGMEQTLCCCWEGQGTN